MRRALPLAFTILPALAATALVGPSAATPSGTIGFSGRVIDGNASLAPGTVVTIHGDVIARSESCIEARVAAPGKPHRPRLWLCSPDHHPPGTLPGIGEPVAARARITGIRTTADGAVPYSDSFILMRVD